MSARDEAAGAPPPPEFSRPVAADKIGRGGLAVEIEANSAERAALARRFGLAALDALQARCRLKPVAGGMIELACDFAAKATQECVVTLAPVAADIVQGFTVRYALSPVAPGAGGGDDIDLEADDPPEAMEGGAIDLGEAVAQHLALALDPYPRAPGARFAGGEGEKTANPFAILSKLKGKS
jgi:uncharacterized metal-binding protein YceD (DUF177 family)